MFFPWEKQILNYYITANGKRNCFFDIFDADCTPWDSLGENHRKTAAFPGKMGENPKDKLWKNLLTALEFLC